jgi:hypothetical protein
MRNIVTKGNAYYVRVDGRLRLVVEHDKAWHFVRVLGGAVYARMADGSWQ